MDIFSPRAGIKFYKLHPLGINASRGATAQRGFTLIEITIAILILASSLVTLLGLQSASMQRAVRDRNKQYAMLMVRRMLAEYETGVREADIGQMNGPATEFFTDLVDEEARAEDMNATLSTFEVDVTISYWDLTDKALNPAAPVGEFIEDEQSFKRIEVAVHWTDDPRDRVAVQYFMPSDEGDYEEF